MITFFTTFKNYGPRERYALASWERMVPEDALMAPEILIYAASEDVERLQEETGRTVWSVPATKGRPHVDAMFQRAEIQGSGLPMYVNSDIMLLPRVYGAIKAVVNELDEFVVTSQRWDAPLALDFDMEGPNWVNEAVLYVQEHGVLHPTSGMDIFAWRGEPWGVGCGDIPQYIVGCYAWDTDLMCMALESGVPVVDITQAAPYGVIHQNHRLNNRRDTPEAKYNMGLLGRYGDWRQRLRGTQHATHVLERDLTLRKK